MIRQLPHHKILIIQTAFIGDVVLVTPLIRAVRRCAAEATLHVMVIPAAQNIVENNPALNEVLVYDKRGSQSGWRGFFRMCSRVRREKYGLVLVPHRSLRSALIAWCSGARVRVGFSNSAGAFLLSHRVRYIRSQHEIDRNLSLLASVACPAGRILPELFATEQDQQFVGHLLAPLDRAGMSFIAVAPGSVWKTKRWPADYYHKLLKKLSGAGYAIVLLGGSQDRELCEAIAAAVPGLVINSAGVLTLRQAAWLLSRAAALVANDSAPLHLGSAANVPMVALFGPTIPGFGFAPYSDHFVVVETELPCRPCGIHGGERCPIGTHACMIHLRVDEVYQETLNIINQKKDYERNHQN